MSNLKFFSNQGYASIVDAVSPEACIDALEQMTARRPFDEQIFMTEQDFKENRYPWSPAGNLLDHINMDFIEKNKKVVDSLTSVLGANYEIYANRVIVNPPRSIIPQWVEEIINDSKPINLGAYIKSEYRDVRTFSGIDFHQDLMDFPNLEPDFVTLYVYLDEVTMDESPLFVIPGSHLLGADLFPHNLNYSHARKNWEYTTRRGVKAVLPDKALTGSPGSVNFWHGCLLHGTRPNTGSRSRVSIRYIFQKAKGASTTLLDEINASIRGELTVSKHSEEIPSGVNRKISQLYEDNI